MTINGAITELQLLLKASDMPTYYKPCIKKIIETIQMELVCQMHRLDEIEHRIEMHEKAMAKVADTPQTDCDTCKHYNPHHEAIACERCLDGKYSRYEPQTDCGWGKPND